jgi:hypothetical protein
MIALVQKVTYLSDRARICKLLRSPGIDARNRFRQPNYVAWRAGTTNRVVVPTHQGWDSIPGLLQRFTNTGSGKGQFHGSQQRHYLNLQNILRGIRSSLPSFLWSEEASALGPPAAYISHHPTHNYTDNTPEPGAPFQCVEKVAAGLLVYTKV